jgi:sec-independent protein translocase protein TatC
MAIPKSQSGEMPFLDHLEELRWRIIYALGAVLIGVGIGFYLAIRYDVVGWLARPIMYLLPEKKLVFTHPSEGFTIILDVAVTFGLIVASPIVIMQIWAFLVPALKPQEKRVGLVVLFAGILLFIGGAALAYFVVVPLAIPWLFEFGGPSLIPLITAEEYFSFLFEMVLTFGISFELPIVILALAALGIVTPQFLNKYRRHAIVLIVVVGAFLTPGDLVWTTIAMAVPLYALYELSVLGALWVYRWKQKRLTRLTADADADRVSATSAPGSADTGSDDARGRPRSLAEEDERTDR